MKRDQHVMRMGGGWAVQGENEKRASVITLSKNEAINIAQEKAKRFSSQVIVHAEEEARVKNHQPVHSIPKMDSIHSLAFAQLKYI